MGRGSSGITSGTVATSVVTQAGKKINLAGTPLIYGGLDKSISAAQRKILEAQEKKRLVAKREHALLVGQDGSVAGAEVHGGSGSCKIPIGWSYTKGAVLTHNHPRGGAGEDWVIGGTFSPGDIKHFSNGRYATMRASAAEGTYSITKGSNFNGAGFITYAKGVSAAATRKHNQTTNQLKQDCASNKITYTDYRKGCNKAFNSMLIEIHNGLMSGQKTYGYSYTLERRK